MDLLNKIDLMIDDAIAKARNEGFAEGVKWHKVQTNPTERAFVADGGPTIEENDTPFCVREDCDCDNANPNDPIIEEYDNHGNEDDKSCLISCECRDYDTSPLYYVDQHRVTKEQYDRRNSPPEDRYEEYNDEVWPGEDQAEEGDGE